MSEENKRLIRDQVELIHDGKIDQLLEGFSADFVDHVQMPGQPSGREGVGWRLNMIRTAFPDVRFTIEMQVAEGDKVANWYTMRGTNTGKMMGMPATGRTIEIASSDVIRIRDGKVVEHWGLFDQMGMMQQLGMIPGLVSRYMSPVPFT